CPRLALDQLEDGGADEDAVPLLEARLADLLAVDEGAVGAAQVLDQHLPRADGDLRVLAADHVLDQDHVQLARAPDGDLTVHLQGELAPLVLAGDETEGPGPVAA